MTRFTDSLDNVVKLLKKGFTTEQIAKKTGVTGRTIATRRRQIMEKHNAKNSFHLGYILGKKGR